MNCNTIQKKLDLYAGEDLDGREAAEVSAHLKRCLACYRDFTELRDLLATVRATRNDSGDRPRGAAESEQFVAGVMQEIHGPPPAAPQLVARLSMVSGWAAALLLGLTLGWRTFAGSTVAPASHPVQGNEPNVIDHGGGSDPRLSTVEYGVDDELGRQLDQLRRNDRSGRAGGPSRSPQVPFGPDGTRPIKVRRNL